MQTREQQCTVHATTSTLPPRCCHLYRRMTRTVHVSERRLHWRQRRGRERDSLNHWQAQEGGKGDGTDSFFFFFSFLTLTYTVLCGEEGGGQTDAGPSYACKNLHAIGSLDEAIQAVASLPPAPRRRQPKTVTYCDESNAVIVGGIVTLRARARCVHLRAFN